MSPSQPPQASLNRPIRLAVLISGGGTTLLNFLEKMSAGELSAEVPLVIASRPDCSGIAKCEKAGLRCDVVARKSFPDTASFSHAIFEKCREVRADLVTLAGFLSLIEIPDDFSGRVMNIHPALIPAFCGQGMYGHKVHEAVLARGAKVSGCTVHFADNRYDHGPIILQRSVPVEEEDTADTLAARVFTAECETYPEAIRLFAAGCLEIEDSRTRILRNLDTPRALTAVTLSSIEVASDDDLWNLLFDYVQDYLEQYPSDEYPLALFRLPRGLQMIWHISGIEFEVPNGGFWQFFNNSSGAYAVETLEALRLLGAPRRAAILERALRLFKEEFGRPTDHRERWFSNRADDQNRNPDQNLERPRPLDQQYCQAVVEEEIDAIPYIRANPREFVHP